MRSFLFLKQSKQWIKFAGVFAIALVVIKCLSHEIHIIMNRTDSLPYKAFVQLPKKTPHKGDYTLVSSAWYDGVLIKKIIGVEGDEISYTKDGKLKVGSEIIHGQKSKSKDGRKLTNIKKMTIPKGYVFLFSPHPSSFDSRYSELGLVPSRDLQGTAYPIKWIKS